MAISGTGAEINTFWARSCSYARALQPVAWQSRWPAEGPGLRSAAEYWPAHAHLRPSPNRTLFRHLATRHHGAQRRRKSGNGKDIFNSAIADRTIANHGCSSIYHWSLSEIILCCQGRQVLSTGQPRCTAESLLTQPMTGLESNMKPPFSVLATGHRPPCPR